MYSPVSYTTHSTFHCSEDNTVVYPTAAVHSPGTLIAVDKNTYRLLHVLATVLAAQYQLPFGKG